MLEKIKKIFSGNKKDVDKEDIDKEGIDKKEVQKQTWEPVVNKIAEVEQKKLEELKNISLKDANPIQLMLMVKDMIQELKKEGKSNNLIKKEVKGFQKRAAKEGNEYAELAVYIMKVGAKDIINRLTNNELIADYLYEGKFNQGQIKNIINAIPEESLKINPSYAELILKHAKKEQKDYHPKYEKALEKDIINEKFEEIAKSINKDENNKTVLIDPSKNAAVDRYSDEGITEVKQIEVANIDSGVMEKQNLTEFKEGEEGYMYMKPGDEIIIGTPGKNGIKDYVKLTHIEKDNYIMQLSKRLKIEDLSKHFNENTMENLNGIVNFESSKIKHVQMNVGNYKLPNRGPVHRQAVQMGEYYLGDDYCKDFRRFGENVTDAYEVDVYSRIVNENVSKLEGVKDISNISTEEIEGFNKKEKQRNQYETFIKNIEEQNKNIDKDSKQLGR